MYPPSVHGPGLAAVGGLLGEAAIAGEDGLGRRLRSGQLSMSPGCWQRWSSAVVVMNILSFLDVAVLPHHQSCSLDVYFCWARELEGKRDGILHGAFSTGELLDLGVCVLCCDDE